MIYLSHVCKTFKTKTKEVHAVHDVSLHIQPKEIFGIIGFSGAGKSTLIRCMNLLERPTSGGVKVAGKDLMKLSEKELRETRKKIGMIFQHFHLMNRRTVYQNIAFPLKDQKLSKEEVNKKVSNLLELVGLTDKKDAYPFELSGGQKQRVAIARALANDPQVLLCDEATSALDPQTTKSILNLLRKVNEELGVTIVLITHEMAVVKEICDRVAIMEHGCIKEEGDILQVFSNPQAKITQDFLASTMNVQQAIDVLRKEMESAADIKCFLKLQYIADRTKEAMISYISKTYLLDVSILFGNIEIVKDVPIGNLIVCMQGEETNMEQAVQYMKEQEIQVEVLSC